MDSLDAEHSIHLQEDKSSKSIKKTALVKSVMVQYKPSKIRKADIQLYNSALAGIQAGKY